eukprot:scaffold65166_cov63-Phaeocystis_antarctica.AAC.6
MCRLMWALTRVFPLRKRRSAHCLHWPAGSYWATRVCGRRAMAEDLGVRPPDYGQAGADASVRPRPPEGAGCPSSGARRAWLGVCE